MLKIFGYVRTILVGTTNLVGDFIEIISDQHFQSSNVQIDLIMMKMRSIMMLKRICILGYSWI